MKKIYNLSVLLLALTANFAFTSCDDDVDIAFNLSGDWQGDFGMYFSDGRYEYDASYSYIRFVPDYKYATHGTGEEIDYFDWRCPIRTQSFYFDWSVDNGVLRLRYPYAPNLNVDIYHYVMDRNYFSGDVGNTTFTLTKLYDFYDWHDYSYYDNYTYGYDTWNRDYYGGYYYGKTRADESSDSSSSAAAADSVPADSVSGMSNLTFGRRF